jgi:hypothetical protein
VEATQNYNILSPKTSSISCISQYDTNRSKKPTTAAVMRCLPASIDFALVAPVTISKPPQTIMRKSTIPAIGKAKSSNLEMIPPGVEKVLKYGDLEGSPLSPAAMLRGLRASNVLLVGPLTASRREPDSEGEVVAPGDVSGGSPATPHFPDIERQLS